MSYVQKSCAGGYQRQKTPATRVTAIHPPKAKAPGTTETAGLDTAMRLGDPVEGDRPRNHVFGRVGNQVEQDHADAERLVARDPLPEAAAGRRETGQVPSQTRKQKRHRKPINVVPILSSNAVNCEAGGVRLVEGCR